jgi:hypothetical protein
VVRGVVPALLEPERPHATRPHDKRPAKPPPRAESTRSLAMELSAVHATPTPVATRIPGRDRHVTRRARRPTAAEDPAQGTTPTSHENAPISPAPPATTSDFTPAPTSGSGTQGAPAGAPATGGEEFGP